METEQTPVETYATGVLEVLMAYGRKELTDDGLVSAVVKLRNECLDAEKRAHQNWFNKGFEFYHEQITARKLAES
jgi:hypothetical protein